MRLLGSCLLKRVLLLEVEIREAEIEDRFRCNTALVEEVKEVIVVRLVRDAMFGPSTTEEVAPICLRLKIECLVQSEIRFEGTLLKIEVILRLLFGNWCS